MELMRHLLIQVLLFITVLNLFPQGRVITGTITDSRKVPIAGPTICQINTANCSRADVEGMFQLVLNPSEEEKILVECLGFKTVELSIDGNTPMPLTIVLMPLYDLSQQSDLYREEPRFVMRTSLPLDFFFVDFDDFASLIGSYNTDVMGFFGVAGPEIGVSFSNFYTGFSLEWGYDYSREHDSLIVDYNITVYSLNFGYDIVQSTRLRITPLISLKWMRFRLLNYDKDRKILLTQYLDERDLDLRFNQLTLAAGLDLDYKIYFDPSPDSQYFTIGLSGGYIIKLTENPWLYSRGNRLTTNNEISLKNFTFGLNVSFAFR